MNTWLSYHWDRWRTSYWFLPSVMAGAAIVLSLVTLSLDHFLQDHLRVSWDWSYTGGADGARAVLATVAGSMITVAATVFSVATVTLSLASGQLGPRLLRTYIRDRRNQFVLGAFVSTFAYCLLVLRAIRGNDNQVFVPGISVAVGIFGGLFCLGVLIYYINLVAQTIQAPYVIAAVTEELCDTIDRLWPEDLGHESTMPAIIDPTEKNLREQQGTPFRANRSGYLDAIDDTGLLRIAREHDVVIRLDVRPGHFLVKGNVIGSIVPPRPADEELEGQVNKMLLLSSQRTPFQDVEFAIDQLVEVAVRSLSPGINDPFTAMNCIDRLSEALCRLLGRSVPSPVRYDDDDRPRVLVHPASFGDVADVAFNQIRQYGRSSAAVMIRLLETIAAIAEQVRRPADVRALRKHADLVLRAATQSLPEEADRHIVEERYTKVLQLLNAREPVASAGDTAPTDDDVALQSEQSMAASDAPSWTPVTGVGPPRMTTNNDGHIV